MPAAHGLLDHVLDRRLVDDRQHLLRLRLGGGEEPGAQPGGGDDGLADVGQALVMRRFYSLPSGANERSSPRRSRSRLSRWRMTTSTPHAAKAATSAGAADRRSQAPTGKPDGHRDRAGRRGAEHLHGDRPHHREHERHAGQQHQRHARRRWPRPCRRGSRGWPGYTWPSTAASPHATPTAAVAGGQAGAGGQRPLGDVAERARRRRPGAPSCGRCWTRRGCRSPPGWGRGPRGGRRGWRWGRSPAGRRGPRAATPDPPGHPTVRWMCGPEGPPLRWHSGCSSASGGERCPPTTTGARPVARSSRSFQSFSDDPLTTCEACGGELRKLFGAPGIAFKGSGFYKNDSRGSRKSTTTPSSDKGSSDKSLDRAPTTSSSDSSSSSNGSGGSKKEPAASSSSKSDSSSS